jgi:hypothetical protein
MERKVHEKGFGLQFQRVQKRQHRGVQLVSIETVKVFWTAFWSNINIKVPIIN